MCVCGDAGCEIPEGTCHCGCGGRTRVSPKSHTEKGWVRGQPRRWMKGHHTRQHPDQYTVAETGCWEWNLALDTHGYSTTYADGRMRQAYVVFYERAVGPVPDGLELDHLCRNRICVNPAHLEPVTHQENCRRRSAAQKEAA